MALMSKTGCNAIAKCDSAEENNCTSSGMTSDEENQMELNLELTIGLLHSRRYNSPSKKPAQALIFNVAESKLQQVPPGVCLCCQLGFQKSDDTCRNCQNKDGFFRLDIDS
ncbi:hypothetical protein SAY87_011373 [Trapa incisa]|nr:hypothetical protein SAY87_011373 [Trapa incisa]